MPSGVPAQLDEETVWTTLQMTQGKTAPASKLLHCSEWTLLQFLRHHPDMEAKRRALLPVGTRAPSVIFDPPPEEMRTVILAKDGNQRRIAAHLGVSTRVVHDYLDRYPELRDLAAGVREALLQPTFARAFEPDPRLFAEQIKALNANLGALARYFGVNRSTVLEYLDRHPELQQICYDTRETMLDMGEASLYRAVLAGEAWAVQFFLKTRGRMRGYVERLDTFSAKLDLNKLSVEQLQRLAAGEHPTVVLGTASAGLLTAGPRPYPAADAGAGDPGAETEGD